MSDEFKAIVEIELDSASYSRAEIQLDDLGKKHPVTLQLDIKEAEKKVNAISQMIDALNRKTINLGANGGQSLPTGRNQTVGQLKNIQVATLAAHEQIQRLQDGLRGLHLDNGDIKNIIHDLDQMNLRITNLRTSTTSGKKFSVSIEGLDENNNKLRQTIEYINKIVDKKTKQRAWVQGAVRENISMDFGTTPKSSAKKELNEAEQHYKEMLEVRTKINQLIKMRKSTKDGDDTTVLDSQIQKYFARDKELYDEYYDGLTQSHQKYIDRRRKLTRENAKLIDESIRNSEKQAEAQKSAAESEKANRLYQSTIKDAGKDDQRVAEGLARIRVQTDATTEAVRKYQSALSTLNAVDDATSTRDKVQAVEQYERALSDLELQIRKNRDAEASSQKQTKLELNKNAFSAQIDVWSNKNSKAAEHYKAKIDEIKTRLKECDAIELANLRTEWTTLTREAQAAGLTVKSFDDELKSQFQKITAFFTLDYVVDRAVDAIRDMYQQVLQIDTAMTDLLKVTDETSQRYQEFMKNASGSAKELGRSMSGYITQTAEWAKTGYSMDESEQLAKISSIYANVGDVDDSTAVSDVVTAMKAYNITASDAIKIVDTLNKLGNEFAVAAKGLGAGMANSASAMALSNTTFEQTMALLTGISEITQSPAEAGSFLKVASMRIRGMKGELEALGEEVDSNVDSISKVQTQILNLTHGEVNIFDGAGEFRNYYEIMQDIADVYDELNSTEQSSLTEILFGKMRGNQGAAMIQAFKSGQIEKAFEAATNSAGSAMAEQAKWMESLEARIGKLSAAWQSFSESVLSSDFLKGLIDTATAVLDVLEKIIDSAGVLPTIFTAATAALSFNNVGERMNQFRSEIHIGTRICPRNLLLMAT